MAVDPGLGGARMGGGRPPRTARQRVWIIIAFIAVGAFAFALTGLIGGKHKPADTGARSAFIRTPFSEPTEAAKPVSRPVPQSIVAPPPLPRPVAATFTPTKDAQLEAPIFSTAGQAYDGAAANARPGSSAGPGEKDDEFTTAMTASSVGAAAKAKRMKHPELTIPAGIVIPCILQTAINSELMGFVDCVLPGEVRSADGTVTLFDKGTQVMGQIRSALRRGQNRLFILWSRARTPDNVTVDLASPAADELGRAGVGCQNGTDDCVNTHFWKMLANSVLYSLIEYGPTIAATALQNLNHGNNSVTTNMNFLSPQQSMANTILQDDLRIPPTLEKNQGDTVSIFVARDLDFSHVYDLRSAR